MSRWTRDGSITRHLIRDRVPLRSALDSSRARGSTAQAL
ncbi:hypothetical protein I546_2184 [Mycobacterium kansasii 732]|nr:hypothetical protein I546_2184 [Mycobacterium kansasii 732]